MKGSQTAPARAADEAAGDAAAGAAGAKKTVEAQRLEGAFAQLEVLWETGDFTAEGPGGLRLWRRDDQPGERPTAAVTVRPNVRSVRQASLPCELVDIAFRGRVAGNLGGPDAVFNPQGRGEVDVTHGPVRDFGVRLPRVGLEPGVTRMHSDRLDLRHLPGPPRPDGAAGPKSRTLVARGDVKIDGRTPSGYFTADAPVASYDEAKGRLTLSGTRPDGVMLFRSVTAHGPRSQSVGREVVFYPDRNEVVTQGVSGLDGLP